MKFSCLLISLFFYQLALAQFGRIEGLLYDSTNVYRYPFAPIQIRNTLVEFDSYTDENGNFSFNNLPVGIYEINCKFIGIKDSTVSDIKVYTDSTTKLKINFRNPYCEYDNSIKNKSCPVCHKKNKVIPIGYGFSPGSRRKKVYPGGCIITICDPNWFCERDSTKF